MKKILSLILALLMMLSLAACADPQPADECGSAGGTGSPDSPAAAPGTTAGTAAASDAETVPAAATASDAETTGDTADTAVGTADTAAVTEQDDSPTDAFTHDWPVRILVRRSASYDIAEGTNAGALSAALADRDAVFAAAWSSAPVYTVDNTVDLSHDLMTGADRYDLCLWGLSDALNAADGLAYDLNGLDLQPDSQVWEQGLRALTFNGRTLIAAPAAGKNIGDGTYAVFYDPEADGGALKEKLASLDGWTWEQMTAFETESAQLREQGMSWGDRALSALLIGGGFRLTSDTVDAAEDYMTPIIDYAVSGKVTVPAAGQGSPFGSGSRVFTVGKLGWLYDTEKGGTYDRVTVLPLPGQSADQPARTTSFTAGCLFIPGTVNSARTADCAAAMYLFALAAEQAVKTAYMEQLIPAADSVSRRNAEALCAARAYDFVPNGAAGWSTPDVRRLKTDIGMKRKEYQTAIARWERYSKAE